MMTEEEPMEVLPVLPESPTESTVAEYSRTFAFDGMQNDSVGQDERFDHALDFVINTVFWWVDADANDDDWLLELSREWAYALMDAMGFGYRHLSVVVEGAAPAGPLPSRAQARLSLRNEIGETLLRLRGERDG